jgi:hypothetical protein
VTPAERDEVRGIASMRACCEVGAGALVSCGSDTCVMARAILRYVPAGDIGHAAVRILDVEQDIPPAFRNSIRLYGVAAMQPEEARAVGLALLAAADAAEES